jgi:hypothetical protein
LSRRFAVTALIVGSVLYGQVGFSGTYRLEGEVSPIEFTVTQAGEGYSLAWQVDEIRFAGKGLARNGILAGILMQEDGGTAILNVVFKQQDGGLSGYLFVEYSLEANPIGTKGTGAFELGSYDLEGTYSVTGTYPWDTVGYKGSLDLKRTSGTWEATWRLGDVERAGTGVVVDDLLVVGFDTGEGAGLVMYRIERDTLSGVWFGSPDSELGNGQPIVTGKEKCIKRNISVD